MMLQSTLNKIAEDINAKFSTDILDNIAVYEPDSDTITGRISIMWNGSKTFKDYITVAYIDLNPESCDHVWDYSIETQDEFYFYFVKMLIGNQFWSNAKDSEHDSYLYNADRSIFDLSKDVILHDIKSDFFTYTSGTKVSEVFKDISNLFGFDMVKMINEGHEFAPYNDGDTTKYILGTH